MIQKGLAFFFLFVLAPLCTGMIPACRMREERQKWITVYIAGFILNLAVFQIAAVPVVLKNPYGFPVIVVMYTVLLVLASGIGIFCGLPWLGQQAETLSALPWLKQLPGRGKRAVRTGRKTGRTRETLSAEGKIYAFLAILLIFFQMYMAYAYAPFDGDDAYYVVQSVLTDQTDTLYRILPYTGFSTSLDERHALAVLPVWEAYIARMTGIHAAIVAHTLLPLVLIPLTYLIYLQIGRQIFKENRMKISLFLIFISLLQIWGNTSIYTNATFFLMRTWQGKAMLCNLVLLVTIWMFLEIAGKERDGYWFLLLANSFVAAMTSTMGAFLAAVFMGIAGLIVALHRKRWKILLKTAGCAVPCALYLLVFLIRTY